MNKTINWKAIFMTYKLNSIFYKRVIPKATTAQFDQLEMQFFEDLAKVNDIKKQLRGFYDMMESISDNHSFIIPSDLVDIDKSNFYSDFDKSKALIQKFKDVFVIQLPAVFLSEESMYKDYLNYHFLLFEDLFFNNKIDSLIIDIRDNQGGNLWAMVGALNFLFDNQIIGATKLFDSKTDWRFLADGLYDGEKLEMKVERRNNIKFNGKIAVLINAQTCSSAEALVVALKSTTNEVKVFGTNSGGYTSGNEMYNIDCGSKLYVAEGFFQDVHGVVYENGICPDVVCDDANSLEYAITWIN